MSARLHPLAATVMSNGTVQLLEKVQLPFPAKAIVTLLIEEDAPETAQLSQAALNDWTLEEEDSAWAHLQEDK